MDYLQIRKKTGLTYGYLTKIDDVARLEQGKVIISPVLKIERCYRSQQCYRGEWFAWF